MGSLITRQQHGALARVSGGPLPKYIRTEEVHAALARLEGVTIPKLRAHAFVRCLWELGPRVSELLALKVEDVDWTAGVVRLQTLKQTERDPQTGQRRKRTRTPWRVVPAKPGLMDELARYLTATGLKDPIARLWTWKRRFGHDLCSRALQAIGVEKTRAHPRALRHGFGVNCALQGVPQVVIQEWMGHASVETTNIYTRIIARDARPWHDGVEF